MGKTFIEENGIYQIDLSNTINAIGDLNDKFKSIGNFLSDVDFIAETEHELYLIEYKNTEVENAKNPNAFYEKISNGKIYDWTLKKYYGSAFYILSTETRKKVNFILVLECKKADKTIRKRMRNSLAKRLPYKLQELDEIKINLISKLDVLSLEEWNSHPDYNKFPLSRVAIPVT